MKCENFKQIIQHGKETYGTLPALRTAEADGSLKTVTYAELADLVEARAEALSAQPYGCVGLYGLPSVDWIVDLFAAPIAGKRTVLLDASLSREVTQSLIETFGIEAILPSNTGFKTTAIAGGEVEYPGHILVFTSGTSASNKAVVLSQKALAYSAWNGQQMLACGPDDVIVEMLPLSHVFGLVCTLLWPLSFGACVGIGRGMRYYTEDPKTFGTTILVMVPTLLSYLLTTDSINPECHTVLVGAAPCGDHVLNAIRDKGIRVSFGYGLSETASGLAISVGSDDPFALDLCPDTTCRISEEGEVLISTPCMMEGYWHRPEETVAALKNGVLYTGDLGEIDGNGRLRLKGRKNDVLVLSNGEKIFCPEWEEQLAKELGPEIAVILYQNAPALVIGNGGPEADAAKVVDRFNAGQSISKRIKYIQVVDGPLPRTATGKLRRWKVEELLS